MDFLDEEQATELVERFQKRKRGKHVIPKGIDFRKSILNFADRDMLKQHDEIPLFQTDSNFARVNNCIVITYIAHKNEIFEHCPKILSRKCFLPIQSPMYSQFISFLLINKRKRSLLWMNPLKLFQQLLNSIQHFLRKVRTVPKEIYSIILHIKSKDFLIKINRYQVEVQKG